MPCYQCGGEGGSETNLCPSCRDKRLSDRRRGILSVDSVPMLRPPPVDRGSLVKAALLIAGSVLVVYFLCFSDFGPGLALSRGEEAYRRCRQSAAAKADAVRNEEDCRSCKQNPDSEACRSSFMP